MTLTPAGQYLFEQAKEILTLTAKTKSNLQSTAIIKKISTSLVHLILALTEL
ncbi:hypothetical protein FC94_GL001892 [Lactobacillus kefiranofaciens subsp. kefirgranum DSM 10550 = JCM 8572]|nr:hypothetical protein FC94_GL001892 [Lactobacillus kefiranofaciens subsp. kefirgranum DSM 10550 = JCM 8572]